MNSSLPVFACLALFFGCAPGDHVSHDTNADAKARAEMEALSERNMILEHEVEYISHRLEQCSGADGLIDQAEYHISRGEHASAQEKLDKVRTDHQGTPHAAKAEELSKVISNANSASGETVNAPEGNEHIEVVKDEKNGLTWYYDRRVPRGPDTTAFFLYLGHKASGGAWLRMHAQYAGDHWIYLDRIVLKAGNLTYEINVDPRLVFTKAGSLFVSEWNDSPASLEEVRAIKEIVGSPNAQIIFHGKRDSFERMITDHERDAIINIFQLNNSMTRLSELEMGV